MPSLLLREALLTANAILVCKIHCLLKARPCERRWDPAGTPPLSYGDGWRWLHDHLAGWHHLADTPMPRSPRTSVQAERYLLAELEAQRLQVSELKHPESHRAVTAHLKAENCANLHR